MTFDEYEQLAARTRNNGERALENATLGLCGEAGEVAEKVKKHFFHGKEIDVESFKSELGDCMWYLAWLANLYGIKLEEVAVANIEKLKRRYPDGFVEGGGNR